MHVYISSIKIMVFMWQFGLVDTFTAINFIYNTGAQYGAIVLYIKLIAAMVEGNITNLPSTFLEPITGLGVSYHFVRAAQTAAERQARVSTLAVLLSASTATALGSTPSTNAALGTAVAAHIAHMKNVLNTRGGGILGSERTNFKIVLNSTRIPILNSNVNPYRKQFFENSRVTINNIFHEHSARRYAQACPPLKRVEPIYLTPIASSQIQSRALIGWTCFGVVLISITTLGALYLFQCSERRRWKRQQNQKDGIII